MGFKSPQTLFGSSGPRGAQWKPEASKMRTISGALWAPKRLLQFGSGKQMLVKLVMPEISGDDAAQKWMWWQRLGFFKPKRLMQFGKFINTGEIGYNLCLAALYCRRRGCLPGKTTTDSTCFCVQSYFIRISVNTNLEQQSPHIKPDWIYGRQGEAPQSCDPFFFVLLVVASFSPPPPLSFCL